MRDNNIFSYEDLVQKYKFSFSKEGEPILNFEGLYWEGSEIFDDNKKQKMIDQFVRDVESCKTDMEISPDISQEDQHKIENMEKIIKMAGCLKDSVRVMSCNNVASSSGADVSNVRK